MSRVHQEPSTAAGGGLPARCYGVQGNHAIDRLSTMLGTEPHISPRSTPVQPGEQNPRATGKERTQGGESRTRYRPCISHGSIGWEGITCACGSLLAIGAAALVIL